MKERIVVDNRIYVTKEYFIEIENVITANSPNTKYIKEQVPETWEELKELCEDLESKDVFITSAGDCIEYHGLQFWKDGRISHDADQSMYAIKLDVTPARQWQIIKSLIGEK